VKAFFGSTSMAAIEEEEKIINDHDRVSLIKEIKRQTPERGGGEIIGGGDDGGLLLIGGGWLHLLGAILISLDD